MFDLNFYLKINKFYLYPSGKKYKNAYIICNNVIIAQTSYKKSSFILTKHDNYKTIWGLYSNHPTKNKKAFICEKFDKNTGLKISDQNVQISGTDEGNHTLVLKFVDNK